MQRRAVRPLCPGRRSRQQVRNGVEQALRDVLRRTRCIDKPHPIRLLGCDQAEGEIDFLVIVFGAAADAVALLIVARAGPSAAFSKGEDERPVGEAPVQPEGIYLADRLDPETARSALVGQRAVDEAVAQDPAATLESRANRLLDMVRPRGGEEQRLGSRPPSFVGSSQQQLTDLLASFAPTGLAGHEDVDSATPKRIGQGLHLRGLAGPFPALEGDEAPAGRHAIPMSCLRPSQMRPKKPARPTSSPATRETICGAVSPVVITSWATSCPFAIGATSGPS